jgi:hypothetical protein
LTYRELHSRASSSHVEYYDFVLNNCIAFEKAELAKNFQVTKNFSKRFRPKPKECFKNAQLLAIYNDDIQYYEGFAYREIIPFEHAWVVVGDKVVDVTLEASNRKAKREKIELPEGNVVYFGMHIPTEYLRKYLIKTEIHNSVLYDYFRTSKC